MIVSFILYACITSLTNCSVDSAKKLRQEKENAIGMQNVG